MGGNCPGLAPRSTGGFATRLDFSSAVELGFGPEHSGILPRHICVLMSARGVDVAELVIASTPILSTRVPTQQVAARGRAYGERAYRTAAHMPGTTICKRGVRGGNEQGSQTPMRKTWAAALHFYATRLWRPLIREQNTHAVNS